MKETKMPLENKVSAEVKETNSFQFMQISEQAKLRRKLSKKQAATLYYFIDIVGDCNLKCPSCPVGRGSKMIAKGQMNIELFSQIIKKIHADAEDRSIFVDIYNWTEPLLHRSADKYITILKDYDIKVGVSTNLSINRDYKDIIKSNPDYIRVSISGFYQSTYGRTHKDGNINLVKSNLYKLRFLLDQYKTDTIIQIGFHIYRDNFLPDFLKVAELCDELGFLFAPAIATTMSLEDVLANMDLSDPSFNSDLTNNLLFTPQDWKDAYEEEGTVLEDCQFRSARTAINYNGSVPQCCAVYDDKFNIAPNFLETTPPEIVKTKYQNPICKTCMTDKMHMMFTGVPSEIIKKKSVEILGSLYEEWLALDQAINEYSPVSE